MEIIINMIKILIILFSCVLAAEFTYTQVDPAFAFIFNGGSSYGDCGRLSMLVLSGWTQTQTDTDFAEDPNLDEDEHDYAFIGFNNVHSSSVGSGEYGCLTCVEIDSQTDDAMQEGDTGFGACWGENDSQAGEETAWISYGTIKAVDSTKVMLEETNGWDATGKLVLKEGADTTNPNDYRYASYIQSSGDLNILSKNLAGSDAISKSATGFSFSSESVIKCYCSDTLSS